MIIGLQIVAILFALCMIYFALLARKRGELSGVEIASWLTLWSFAIVVVVFPELLRTFAKTFLLSRVFDLMTIGGFILVISMATSAYTRTRRTEKKMEDLVRHLALKSKRKRNKSSREQNAE
jgi:hypothetical protein